MVFYGIKSNADMHFQRLEEEISLLSQQRQIINQNNLTTFRREFDISTLTNASGTIITQSILSSQYVLTCISQYFAREWIRPAFHAVSPIIREYQKLPEAATQLKCAIAQKYSPHQRLTAVLLGTSAVCANSLITTPTGLLIASGRILATFGGLSFVALPEMSQSFANSFIFDLL